MLLSKKLNMVIDTYINLKSRKNFFIIKGQKLNDLQLLFGFYNVKMFKIFNSEIKSFFRTSVFICFFKDKNFLFYYNKVRSFFIIGLVINNYFLNFFNCGKLDKKYYIINLKFFLFLFLFILIELKRKIYYVIENFVRKKNV